MKNRGEMMSKTEPGIMFDATNSWNGYNHQGKIALWYVIKKICELIDPTVSPICNQRNLENYFLEIEYMEDFSIGNTVSGKAHYDSVHQVKDRVDGLVSNYESALLGLAEHLISDSTISDAFLHVTSELDLNGVNLSTHITSMIDDPKNLSELEAKIKTKRNIPAFRQEFLVKKPGRPTKVKSALLYVLSKVKPTDQQLTEDNLDFAFDELLKEIDSSKRRLKTLSSERLNHIKLCPYFINGIQQSYCNKDQAEPLLKNQLKDFYTILFPKSYKIGDSFVGKSYLYVLGKLDQHIVERSLNYDAYKKGLLERRILFSTVFEWLVSDEIDKMDDDFYLYHIKERIFKTADCYCKMCSKRSSDSCTACCVSTCMDKLGELSFKQLKNFLHMTNPHIPGSLSMDTYGEYTASTTITNPFLIGLRDIPQVFSEEKNMIAVTYYDFERMQYALTTIASCGTDNDNALICSEIIRNRNIYSLMMDYDALISKDIFVDSIQDSEITLSHRYDSNMSEHIVHCKDVKIVPLTVFQSICSPKEGD